MPGICECGAIGVRVVTVVLRGEAYYESLFDGRMYLCMRCIGSWTLTHRATARVALSLGSEPVHGAPIGSGPAPQGGHDAGVDGAEMPGVHAAAPVLTEQALADVDKRDPAKAAQMPAQHAQWPVAQRSVAPPPPPAAQKRMMPPTPPPAGAGKHRKIAATTPAAVAALDAREASVAVRTRAVHGTVVPPLQTAQSFACSVASLSRFPLSLTAGAPWLSPQD